MPCQQLAARRLEAAEELELQLSRIAPAVAALEHAAEELAQVQTDDERRHAGHPRKLISRRFMGLMRDLGLDRDEGADARSLPSIEADRLVGHLAA